MSSERYRRVSPEDLQVNPERAQEYRSHFKDVIGSIEEDGYKIDRVSNLFAWLENAASSSSPNYEEYRTCKDQVANIVMFDVSQAEGIDAMPMIHSRRAVVIETKDGKRTVVAVARHGSGLKGNFGGAGLYPHKEDNGSPLAEIIQHSEKLATVMTAKSYAIGTEVELRGSKTIIDSKDKEWLKDPVHQFITGMLFSPNGPFPNVITGSDAGQTPETIECMSRGSRSAGGIGGEIVGGKDGLPNTASYCRHTLEATYETLRNLYPENELPTLEGSKASVQGLGKIGMTAAEMLIDRGVSVVYVTDIVHVGKKLDELQARADNLGRSQKVKFVPPESIFDQSASVFVPCSTNEGAIDLNVVDRLVKSGVKVILSGANMPIPEISVAEYAESNGIIFPNETVANGGSATSAAMESLEYLPNRDQWAGNHQEFVKKVLVPHIFTTVKRRLEEAKEISKNEKRSLYESSIRATEIWLEDATAPLS